MFQRQPSQCSRSLVAAILDFHTNRAAIARVAEHRKELTPVDVAEPWQLRTMIIIRVRQRTDLIQTMAVNPHIFGMYMKNPLGKVAQWSEVVHLLKDQV